MFKKSKQSMISRLQNDIRETIQKLDDLGLDAYAAGSYNEARAYVKARELLLDIVTKTHSVRRTKK